MVTPREAALMALVAGRKNGSWPDAFLDSIIKREQLDRRDAALAIRLCCGVLQNRSLCDYYLSSVSSIKLSKLEPIILDILRLSVYQIVFLDRIPNHAAVSEGVKLARKKANPRAAGFVNAVLRKLSSENLPSPPTGNDAESLSVKYSHPEWLIKLFVDEFGVTDCEKLLASDNDFTPVFAQVNTLKATAMQAKAELDKDGVSAHASPLGLELVGCGALDELAAFRNGYIYVQDGAARFAVEAAAPKPGMNVLDGCAAPGGKSFAAAMLMENTGRILSCDIHENKLSRIKTKADRLGIDIIETRAMDARQFNAELDKAFDVVIADVPCSGLGVIRKKPDIRYKDGTDIEALPEIQLAILKNLSRYCKSGGVLLYSTCTVLYRENGSVVERFLTDNDDFVLEPFELPVASSETGMITLLPYVHGTDGFFIAKLRRR